MSFSPSVGLEGETRELAALLAFARNLICMDTDDEDDDLEPEEGDEFRHLFARLTRTRLVGLATDLGSTFEAVETAHRQDHNLTGAKKVAAVRRPSSQFPPFFADLSRMLPASIVRSSTIAVVCACSATPPPPPLL